MRINVLDTRLQDGLPVVIKEKGINYPEAALDQPFAIADMFCKVFDIHHRTEEYVYILCLNAHLCPVGVYEISHGSDCMAFVDTKTVLTKVLLCGSNNVILVHNHPSGWVEPSKKDIECTSQLKKSLEVIGMALTDSIIISATDYYSFRESGTL